MERLFSAKVLSLFAYMQIRVYSALFLLKFYMWLIIDSRFSRNTSKFAASLSSFVFSSLSL